jgi:hypothetical protein
MKSIFAALALAVTTCSGQPQIGQYATRVKSFAVGTLDASDPSVMVIYPSNATKGETFPLISYAHGMAGGGNLDILGYGE